MIIVVDEANAIDSANGGDHVVALIVSPKAKTGSAVDNSVSAPEHATTGRCPPNLLLRATARKWEKLF